MGEQAALIDPAVNPQTTTSVVGELDAQTLPSALGVHRGMQQEPATDTHLGGAAQADAVSATCNAAQLHWFHAGLALPRADWYYAGTLEQMSSHQAARRLAQAGWENRHFYSPPARGKTQHLG